MKLFFSEYEGKGSTLALLMHIRVQKLKVWQMVNA